MATSFVKVSTVDKTDQRRSPSGKRVSLNIAVLLFGSLMGFYTVSRAEQGPVLYIVLVSAIVLLAGAVFEAARWIWRSKRNKG